MFRKEKGTLRSQDKGDRGSPQHGHREVTIDTDRSAVVGGKPQMGGGEGWAKSVRQRYKSLLPCLVGMKRKHVTRQ